VLDSRRVLVAGTPQEIVDAVPGSVAETATRPATDLSWRRGRRWRVWMPPGSAVSDSCPVDPDLTDAVVIAALGRYTADSGQGAAA